ncbi:MAG: hypothetical protein AAF745_05550 [Planctomycetota bacterium]
MDRLLCGPPAGHWSLMWTGTASDDIVRLGLVTASWLASDTLDGKQRYRVYEPIWRQSRLSP